MTFINNVCFVAGATAAAATAAIVADVVFAATAAIVADVVFDAVAVFAINRCCSCLCCFCKIKII